MTQQNINFGAFPDDLNSDAIRTAFEKVQNNFTELYDATTSSGVDRIAAGRGISLQGGSNGTGNVLVSANLYQVAISSNTLVVSGSPLVSGTGVIHIELNQEQFFAGNVYISNGLYFGNSSYSNLILSNAGGTLVFGSANTPISGENLINVPLSAANALTGNTANVSAVPFIDNSYNLVNDGAFIYSNATGTLTAPNVDIGQTLTVGDELAATVDIGNGAAVITNTGNITANSGTLRVQNIICTDTITSSSTLSASDIFAYNLTMSGAARLGDVSQVFINGGINGYVLQTDGTGNLTWVPQAGGNAVGTVSNVTGNGSALGFSLSGTVTTAGNITLAGPDAVTLRSTLGIGNIANGNLNGNGQQVLAGNGAFVALPPTQSGNIGNINLDGNVANVLTGLGTFVQLPTRESLNIGNVANLNLNGNGQQALAGNGDFVTIPVPPTGNIGDINLNGNGLQVLAGNGAWVPQAGGNGAYGNSDVAAFLPTYNGTIGGNVDFSNITVAVLNTHITGGSNGQVLSTDGTGNLSWINQANGNGSTYGNSDVAAYLPTYNGNIGGNIVTSNLTTSVSNLHVTGGSTGQVLSTDGTGNLTWVSGAAAYSNSNVANYLPTYNGNIGGNIVVSNLTGAVGNVHFTGGSNGQVLATNGNGNLSWVTPAANYGNSNVAAFLPIYTGNLSGSNLTITGVSNLGAVGNVRVTGGSTGQVLSTDGAGNLSWVTGAANYGNSNVAAYLPVYSGNIGGNIVVSNLTGAVGNVHITGGSNGQVLSTDGTGNLSWSNTYGNTNVAAYLPTYNGNIGGNIVTSNLTTAVGNLHVTGGTTGQLLSTDGNGALSWVTGAASYSNANVANYLPTYTGNLAGGNLAITGVSDLGEVGNVKITGGTTGQFLQTDGNGVLSWVTGAASYSNANVANYLPTYSGNIGNVTTSNLTVSAVTSLGAVGNVRITGGSSGQVLSTDGNGALSWIAQANGNGSNYSNSDVANYLPTYNGNIGGNIVVSNLTGAVGNIHITGGSNGQVLTTNGNGVLTWSSAGNGGGTPNAIVNGTSNVSIPIANGSILFNYDGNAAGQITDTQVVLGSFAGVNLLGNHSIVLGSYAGAYVATGVAAIAVGAGAGAEGENSIAVGPSAFATGGYSLATGSGSQASAFGAVVVGLDTVGSGDYALAVGAQARASGNSGVALGHLARANAAASILVGNNAGQNGNTSGIAAIGIGNYAGYNGQATGAIAIGDHAAWGLGADQGSNAIAIGSYAGNTEQGDSSIAIGANAAALSQSSYAVALGAAAGQSTQGQQSVAIGSSAAYNLQGAKSVAVGTYAGGSAQGAQSVAVGANAGYTNQRTNAVAVGYNAGLNTQGANAVALGANAGYSSQSTQGVAIGYNAGAVTQGANAIAIGMNAGYTNQPANSIIINATGANLNGTNSGLYISPIRNDTGNTAAAVYYNTATKELTYSAAGGGGGNSSQIVNGTSNVYIASANGNITMAVANVLVGTIASNSIALGANTSSGTDGFFVNPVRNDTGNITNAVYFNVTTKELTYGPAGGGGGGNSSTIFNGTSNVYIASANGNITFGVNATPVGTISANTVSFGFQSGANSQGNAAVAIGYNAGNNTQGANAVAIGTQTANRLQGIDSVAFGTFAGANTQGANSIAVGYSAGQTNQGINAIAIGLLAGSNAHSANAIAIGYQAGNNQQGAYSIALGFQAANITQNGNAVAIGTLAGSSSQGSNAVAIGVNSGNSLQGSQSVAIGDSAGGSSQGTVSVALGASAGAFSQAGQAVAIGYNAGRANQRLLAIAIGKGAGNNTQGSASIAIGGDAAATTQGANSVAIGYSSGTNSQGANAVTIGDNSGVTQQGANAVSIGSRAGVIQQGANAIAIGAGAGYTSQPANSIIINATGANLNGTNSGFYAAPVRTDTGNTTNILYYNTSTKELTYAPLFVSVPASNTATGIAGQMAYNSSGNLYVCVATNTWSRISGTTSW